MSDRQLRQLERTGDAVRLGMARVRRQLCPFCGEPLQEEWLQVFSCCAGCNNGCTACPYVDPCFARDESTFYPNGEPA